ncbi:Potassium channel [Musa troglodytarum]|uniref:Potassium channel n=1 Tax=Musa troglodytarum TaxID=320322 RepID=A0A9E7GMY6_9LILI|nr:Potassium channel [Musa troglodytarum]
MLEQETFAETQVLMIIGDITLTMRMKYWTRSSWAVEHCRRTMERAVDAWRLRTTIVPCRDNDWREGNHCHPARFAWCRIGIEDSTGVDHTVREHSHQKRASKWRSVALSCLRHTAQATTSMVASSGSGGEGEGGKELPRTLSCRILRIFGYRRLAAPSLLVEALWGGVGGLTMAEARVPASPKWAVPVVDDAAEGLVRSLGLMVGAVLLSIGVGTVVLRLLENLDWMNAVYLLVTSVTTIGYGDRAFNTTRRRIFMSAAVGKAFLYLAPEEEAKEREDVLPQQQEEEVAGGVDTEELLQHSAAERASPKDNIRGSPLRYSVLYRVQVQESAAARKQLPRGERPIASQLMA